MGKFWVISAACALLIVGGWYFYLESAPKPNGFPTIKVQKGTIEKQAVAVGIIVPSHSISIKSQFNGIVGKIYVKVGQSIKQGEPLIEVRPNPTPQNLTDALTDLMRSEADLEAAIKTLSNLEILVNQDIIPNNYNDYISARSKLKSTQADVLQKRQKLALIRGGEATIGNASFTSTIYAPIDGTVLNRKVEIGEPIISTESSQAATEVMSVADMNNFIFKGSVNEHDAALLSPGMSARLTIAPYPGVEISGTLTKVALQSDKLNTQKNNKSAHKSFENGFGIEIGELKVPKKVSLRSGFSATARITLSKSENTLTLPERALQFDGNAPYVLIPNSSAQGFHKQKVILGLSDGINVEVLDGVELHQEIIDNSMINGPADD